MIDLETACIDDILNDDCSIDMDKVDVHSLSFSSNLKAHSSLMRQALIHLTVLLDKQHTPVALEEWRKLSSLWGWYMSDCRREHDAHRPKQDESE